MKALWSVPVLLGTFGISGCGYWGNYGGMPGRGMMGYGYGYGGGFMWIILIVFVAVILYLLLRGGPSKSSGGPRDETPLQILEKRYARGEITREQFDDMKKDLSR